MFKKLITLSLLTINTLAAFSQIVDANYLNNQPKENLPLSRFGFGSLTPQYLASSSGFGGMTAAYRDRFNYNPANPASLAHMRMAAFEVGLYGSSNTVTSGTNSDKSRGGGLHYLAVGFPTYSVINEVLDRKQRKLRWGMGFNLMPYSITTYNVQSTGKAVNSDTVTVDNFYIGSGGTYKLMWGNGVSYKGFSAGANIGLLFGRNTYFRQTNFSSNLLYPYTNYFDDFQTVKGFTWNAGAQYDFTIGKAPKVGEKDTRKHLVLGVYGNPKMNFTTEANRLYTRNYAGPTTSALSDTLEVFTAKKGTGTLPSEFTMGVMYENGLKFRGGIEYKSAAWSQYKSESRPQTLVNSNEFSVGAEFILDKNRLKSEEEKMRWRIGYRTGSDPRKLNGEQVSTWAATAGMCLPMRVGRGQTISYLNLGLEYGSVGIKTVKEDYFRINLGFTLNDNSWFLKKKYN